MEYVSGKSKDIIVCGLTFEVLQNMSKNTVMQVFSAKFHALYFMYRLLTPDCSPPFNFKPQTFNFKPLMYQSLILTVPR